MARQKQRLFRVRKPETFDDQKTPAAIAASETSSVSEQDFIEFVLSQLRQILGTSNWHDAVPTDLSSVFASGMAGLTMVYGRNSTTVTGGTYLRSPGDVSSAPTASPLVLTNGATLISAAVGVDGAPGATWEVEIQVNGVTSATLTGASGSPTAVNTSLSVSASAGDRISVRMKPGTPSVSRPAVTLRWRVP